MAPLPLRHARIFPNADLFFPFLKTSSFTRIYDSHGSGRGGMTSPWKFSTYFMKDK